MMDQKRIFGTVFFPESPEIKIPGAWLTITSTSILIEMSHDFFNSKESWPIVLGSFNGLGKITFVNCRNDGGSYGAGGTFTRIRASFCIKGIHLRSHSELNFKRISMSSPALSSWIISKEIVDLGTGKYQVPSHEEIVKVLIDGFELTINSCHQTNLGYDELNVVKTCTVTLSSEELVTRVY